MGPKKAIKIECGYCKNWQRFICVSEICRLNNVNLSSLKRIKAHCLTCVESRKDVMECTGQVLNPEPHKCPLWEFRLGKNPNRKGMGGKFSLKTPSHGAKDSQG